MTRVQEQRGNSRRRAEIWRNELELLVGRRTHTHTHDGHMCTSAARKATEHEGSWLWSGTARQAGGRRFMHEMERPFCGTSSTSEKPIVARHPEVY